MFIRKKKNKSGSVSIQIISKDGGKYKVVKSIGSGKTDAEIDYLYRRALQEISSMKGQQALFTSVTDNTIHSFLSNINNSQVQVIGPELIFGRIYNYIGFNRIENNLFRHLVITRLFHPGSKLKAIDYLQRYLGVRKEISEIYRFLDHLHSNLKDTVEEIAFQHTKKVLGGEVSIVFYDMTTLHFEVSDEDDLRKTGFSKVGRHQDPQIYLGLLVGIGGYAIGYDIHEGDIFEGHTFIPVIQKYEEKYKLNKPIVVADAGLLSQKNIIRLEENNYEYIIGGRIKNETRIIKDKIHSVDWIDGKKINIKKSMKQRLVVSYSASRAKKDAYNRKRGLMRLEKRVKSGKLTKSNLNNKGYNKYLRMSGRVEIEIDYDKYEQDSKWDGLKGYLSNTKLSSKEIIENYGKLWFIERAFRISKTDLKIRPIYHRLRHRIEAHICISFAAYSIYKELERVLKLNHSYLSVKRAAEITHNMYQLNIELPETQKSLSVLLKMDQEQADLYKIILKYF
jgi:transposase